MRYAVLVLLLENTRKLVQSAFGNMLHGCGS